MLKDLVKRMLGGRRGLALQYLLEDETLSEKGVGRTSGMIDAARKRRENEVRWRMVRRGESGEALLLALAHSVWLAGLLLGLCAAIFRAIPAGRAGLRYGILLGAQGMVAVGPIGIWSLLSPGDGKAGGNAGRAARAGFG